jgi:hypothetical protein
MRGSGKLANKNYYLLPEDGDRSSLRNVVFRPFLDKIGTVDIVQNLSFNYTSPSFVTYRSHFMQYIFLLLIGLAVLCYISTAKGPASAKNQVTKVLRIEMHFLSFSILDECFIFTVRSRTCPVGKPRVEGSVCSNERKIIICAGKSNCGHY